MDLRRAVVVLLLVLAGCAGGSPSEGTPSADSALRTTTPTATATTAVTAAEPPGSGDAGAAARNPWRAETVRVAVTRRPPDRSVRPLVERALTYWETNASERAGYELDYELVDGADDADVRVRFVERIDRCGAERSERTAGCADYVPRGERAPSPTDVRVEIGYNDSATVSLLKHEFGHTLGFTHADADALPFMNATTRLGTLPEADVRDRRYHWRDRTLSVHVDYGAVGSDRLADAVESVFDEYETSESVPESFAFVTAPNASTADVTVRFDGSRPPDARSDATYYFVDPDYDGTPEYYTRYAIVLGDVSPRRAGDVIGWYLALALYADGPSEVPDRYS